MGRVLVVDDYPANRELLKKRLEREGHVVGEAADGAEALELLKKESYDLVLLDILMPKMNGYEVLEAIQKDAELHALPVIVITAVENIDSIVKCIEMGAYDYLTKPFNPVILKARVNACLEKKALRDREIKEKKRADELLSVILPAPIIEELKNTERVAPKLYDQAAILFCDVVEFTEYCNTHTPQEVLENLQLLIDLFENLAIKHNTQKIKTSGDSFMCAAGIIFPTDNPVLDCVQCGLEMVENAPKIGAKWEVRVGIHVGPAMAGVVGHRQYLFDVWGDTVNIAARLAEHGSIGSVTLSEKAMEWIEGKYETVAVGKFPIRGIGNTQLYRVLSSKSASVSNE
ncbi:MAG: adenylate/guanylate cyclase domain-containing response regulator [Chlamydiales bacterium]|nr:adenylate/guanylate cyclase domain-containing response regulator [Chlamydiales bacterium]